ncbi:MAG: VPLPA-CTERM sorting domain-containing protein [Rhodobacteraceae bacterium]|nr:VPLPA-CTERM sorting domain-containing protein [Paracoccaceae bacterium]
MKSFIAAFVVSAALTVSASAATTSYTDATAFATAAGTLQVETFAGETARSLAGTQDFGAFTTTLDSDVGGPFNVVMTSGGVNALGLTNENLQVGLLGGDTLTIKFKTAVIAFGGMFAGVNNGLTGRLRSEFLVGGVLSEWLGRTNNSDAGLTARFFGIVSSTPFTEVTFRGLPRSEGFGMDDLRWASAPTPVPLPASGLLLMGAMLAAGLFGRRRARA